MDQALAGIRVLDLSRVLAGPWASQMLADMGAEVIKIERPGQGDETRQWGPPWFQVNQERDPGPSPPGPSAYFLSCNRGKRSVAVDFSDPAGQAIVHKLALESDIVLENFRPGTLAAYGLAYEQLQVDNPGLIHCAITGFGQDGPYRDRAGYDLLIQAMGGLMSVTGEADSEGGEPVKAGVALTDILTGLYAANACMAALIQRGRRGQGQFIDLSLMDVQVASMANQAMNYLVSGQAPGRMGSAHPNIVPYQAFAAADGHFVLAVGNDGQFARLCQVIGHPEWAQDADYAGNAQRVRNRAQLVAQLSACFRRQPRDHWLSRLESASVPAGPVNDMAAVFHDPQVQARQLQTTRHYPDWGVLPSVANPLIRGANEQAGPPPALGQDTRAVLSEQLGMQEEAIRDLAERGVIQLA